MAEMKFRRPSSLCFALLLGVVMSPATNVLAAPDAAGLKFFENAIRPLLAEHCYGCHGPDKQKHGLRVDNLPYLLQGGESGPSVVPGKPADSILLDYLSYTDSDHEMPPDGKLPEEKIKAILMP